MQMPISIIKTHMAGVTNKKNMYNILLSNKQFIMIYNKSSIQLLEFNFLYATIRIKY